MKFWSPWLTWTPEKSGEGPVNPTAKTAIRPFGSFGGELTAGLPENQSKTFAEAPRLSREDLEVVGRWVAAFGAEVVVSAYLDDGRAPSRAGEGVSPSRSTR